MALNKYEIFRENDICLRLLYLYFLLKLHTDEAHPLTTTQFRALLEEKEDIRDYITSNYYEIGFSLDQIRKSHKFDVSCQGSVPVALEAFFEDADFEDAIRNAL